MQLVEKIEGMKEAVQILRRQGKTVGFVPTMGYLHEGHLSLVRASKSEADITVVSIFVNPIQFGPQEDFHRYPRDLNRDRTRLEAEGVDYLFYPSSEEMYPSGFKTYVEVTKLQDVLCGRSRPGHFKGVATVVLKLFNIVTPDLAYFGQKDAQQAVIIQQMVKDLHLNVKVRVLPIVRDNDGLALSSRNVYLSPRERQAALAIPQSLEHAAKLILSGEKRVETIKKQIEQIISAEPELKIDYVEVVQPEELTPLDVVDEAALIAVAVYCGRTRLIDNLKISPKGAAHETDFFKS